MYTDGILLLRPLRPPVRHLSVLISPTDCLPIAPQTTCSRPDPGARPRRQTQVPDPVARVHTTWALCRRVSPPKPWPRPSHPPPLFTQGQAPPARRDGLAAAAEGGPPRWQHRWPHWRLRCPPGYPLGPEDAPEGPGLQYHHSALPVAVAGNRPARAPAEAEEEGHSPAHAPPWPRIRSR